MSEDGTPNGADQPDADQPPESSADTSSAGDADAVSVPMNRAERRAKGKKSAQQGQVGGKQKFIPKGAPAGNTRQWANRRSG